MAHTSKAIPQAKSPESPETRCAARFGSGSAPTPQPVAGIDIGKASLDIARQGCAEPWRIANTPDGWTDLAGRLHEAGIRIVGLEASGGYERGGVDALRARGLEVRLHQPIQVKAFAKLSLRQAKNDRLDARLIAAFTAFQAETHAARPAPDPRLRAFADGLVFIDQAIEDATRTKLRAEHQPNRRLRSQLEADARRADARAAREFARLTADLRAKPDLAERLGLLLSIPGLGEKTAVRLIVQMPELGHLTREQAASLAGLAPFDQDSGQFAGERHIIGGRAQVRTALVALRTRMTARGKTHKQALIACARKLLTRATPWRAAGQPG